jgi:L-lactate dehydrogenase complex protein LldG
MEPVALQLKELAAGGQRTVNTIPEIGKLQVIDDSATAASLSDIENTFLSSQLGVAENGAVWLTEKELYNRILPFITQHLIIVLPTAGLVANMHEAYARIADTDAGYHVFIAGPSKTADIEQSLVIGAHGPRSLLVYLVG